MSGTLIVYHGKGKGKSTAAFGCVLRAVGHEMPSLLVQFIKKPGISGEQAMFAQLGVDYLCAGKGFVVPTMRPSLFQAHEAAARDGIEEARRKLEHKPYRLVVFDEIIHVIHLFPELSECAYQLIEFTRARSLLIVTGYSAPSRLLGMADYVYSVQEEQAPSEMLAIKGFHL